MPSTVVILRHAEKPRGKQSSRALSPMGKKRAQFLSRTYLGRGARRPLFDAPDAFLAITPHTIETASPSAESWGLPVIAHCTEAEGRARDTALDRRTQQAARDVLACGLKTVVMVWEHRRIASAALDPQTTLRHLLNLEAFAPGDWPDGDFDTIWIVRYGKGGKIADFKAMPQGFRPRRTAKTSKRAKARKTGKARKSKARTRRA